jgi:hypothetical protein
LDVVGKRKPRREVRRFVGPHRARFNRSKSSQRRRLVHNFSIERRTTELVSDPLKDRKGPRFGVKQYPFYFRGFVDLRLF